VKVLEFVHLRKLSFRAFLAPLKVHNYLGLVVMRELKGLPVRCVFYSNAEL